MRPAAPPALAAALDYAARGWPVLPIRAGSKLPATPHGVKDATRANSTIRGWYKDSPDTGVAIATGSASGLVVLDPDGDAGEQSLAALEKRIGALPATRESRTGRGRHLFFRITDGQSIRNSAGKLGDSLDVRGDGGYVIVPPSFHPSGRRYEWLRQCDPAPLPTALAALLVEPPTNGTRTSSVAEKIVEGARNQTLASLAGSMRRRGMSSEAICAALATENLKRCDPPLPESEVARIASSVSRYAPSMLATPAQDGEVGAVLRPFSEIMPEPLEWLWPGRIPLGKLTLLIGDPGLGKSLLTLDVASRVSKGTSFADGKACSVGDVILLSAEDDAADTIRPRLDTAGADPSRVHLIEMVKVRLQDGSLGEKSFSLETDLDALQSALDRLRNPRLVVIDPVSAYLGGTDSHSNAEVRGLLAPLAALAGRRKIAVLAVSHLRKSTGNAVHRSIGSIAFAAAARAVWAVAPDPNDSDTRLLVAAKQNLAPDLGGLSFRIVPFGSVARLEWGEVPVPLRADDLLASAENGENRAERRDAEEFLREQLQAGPVGVKDIQAAARGAGLSWRAIETAKSRLGIRAERAGFGPGGRWRWSLPDHRPQPVVSGKSAAYAAYEQDTEKKGLNSATPSIDRIDRNTMAYGGDRGLAEGEL